MAKKKGSGQHAAQGGFVPATISSSHQNMQPVTVGADAPTGLAGQYSRNNPNYHSGGGGSAGHGMSRGAKVAVAVVIVALVAGIAAAGVFIYKEMQKSEINADLHSMTADQMKAVDAELTGSTSFEEPFTMLLLGSDARADDPDMGARTDTIIVVRVDPAENIISMMSIPRDTMINIDGVGTAKFNAAYTYGGASGTISAVKQLCGIDIDHYAEINFEGLVGLIDAIGGIDVKVDEEIDDPDAGGHIDAGKQHLDGEHALIFARSRAYVDGDYTRQANQRKVIMAIIDKGLTAPATELSGLIEASTEFLTTDSAMDFDFIYSLADQIRHNNEKEIRIYSATIPSSTATIDEVSYVIADTAGVKAMTKIFNKGGDISKGVSESSISEDIAAAGATTGDKEVGTVGEVEPVEEDYYYYEEETYAEPTSYSESEEVSTETYDETGAEAADGGEGADGGAQADYAEGESGGEGDGGGYEE